MRQVSLPFAFPTPPLSPNTDVRSFLLGLIGVVLFVTGVIVGVTYVHVSDGAREPWRSKTQGSAATAVLSTSTRGLRRAASEQAGPVDMDGVCQLAPVLHCV